MNAKLKSTLLAGLVAITGGAGVFTFVGEPALQSSYRLEDLRQAQYADDAEYDASRNIVLPAAKQLAVGKNQEKPNPTVEASSGQQSENLQQGESAERSTRTDRIANGIAIESLRATNAVYFLTFVVSVASIIGLLGALFSASDSARSLRLATAAARSRVGIKITGTLGQVVDAEIFGTDDCAIWLHSVRSLDDLDLRQPGVGGMVYLAPGKNEAVHGDITSALHGEGVAIEYTDPDGTKRKAIFKLRKIGGEWNIVERED